MYKRQVKEQIKKPRPDLAARLEREVKKRWQPQIRAKAKQTASLIKASCSAADR